MRYSVFEVRLPVVPFEYLLPSVCEVPPLIDKGVHAFEPLLRASLSLLLQNIKRPPANANATTAPMIEPTILPTALFDLVSGITETGPLRLPMELFIFMISNPLRIASGYTPGTE
uniref:Kinase family protein n=1 Tax=Rhizophora mucronata TaxID=61149 RepID=A0A2P2KR59_RHIMU